jgi:SAM-dependent methyltransferase
VGTISSKLNCLSCKASLGAPWLTDCPDEYLGTPFRVTYYECPNCKLVQQSPVPADIAPFYPQYPQHKPRSGLLELARRTVLRSPYFQPPLAARDWTLLDYGCGDGSYLAQWRNRVGRLLGFEPDAAHAATLADRLALPVYSDPKPLIKDYSGTVDRITAHFVLEHVTDIAGSLQLMSALLRPDGRIHLALPDIRSWEARIFGRHWHGLDAPRHICFPDRDALDRIGRVHGLRVATERPAYFPNLLAASLATVLAGKYHHLLFLAMMPVGMLAAACAPRSIRVYEMVKIR